MPAQSVILPLRALPWIGLIGLSPWLRATEAEFFRGINLNGLALIIDGKAWEGNDTVAVVKARGSIDWNKAREWWSLRPLTMPQPPEVADSACPANDIDPFILARLEQAKFTPVGGAAKRTLIRRATFELIGLPPAPEEIDAFLADQSPGAFAKVVDRLLASPRYGERWGRHWLDVVRYADTAGDNSDFPVPQMYRYRHWVIAAFNQGGLSAYAPIERLFDPANGIFTAATAAKLLGLRPTEEEKARLEYLANQANEGRLTSEEREEYETRIRLGKVISVMQLEAKLLVRSWGGP